MSQLETGVLADGFPYDRLGSGPREIVVLPGISFENKALSQISVRALLGPFRFLEHDFTVSVVNRRPGLRPGSTIANMAADHATMLRAAFDPPVDLIGVSTGGSIAMQLAIDHPDLIRRLVLYSAAHRLGDDGRLFQRRQAALAREGRWGTAMAEGMALMLLPQRGLGRLTTWPLRWLFAALGLLIPKPADPADFLVTVDAEEAFDVQPRLGEIRAPTLLVAGARDPFYSPALFRTTAAGIPGARLALLAHGGHVPTGRVVERAILRFMDAG